MKKTKQKQTPGRVTFFCLGVRCPYLLIGREPVNRPSQQSETGTPPSSLLQGLRLLEVAGRVSKLLVDDVDDGLPSVIYQWGTMASSYYNLPTVVLLVCLSHPNDIEFLIINQ